MSKLFIANCTKQVQDFTYRLPEATQTRTQKIQPGAQIRIAGELSPTQIEDVIRHHQRYGLVKVDEIDRTRGFSGMCWDEKEISVSKLQRGMEKVTDVLVARGREIRKENAVAANNSLQSDMRETGTGTRLRQLETSVTEENHDSSSNTEELSEGVRVMSEAGESAPSRGRGGKRRGG